MTSVVVDASVAVKWFVPEIHSDAAAAWLDRGCELLAPDLIFAELGNIVWKKIGRRELDDEEGRAVLRGVRSVPFTVHPARDLLPLAFEIALGLRRTAYDSMYLALAVTEGSVFVTADRRFYETVAASVLAKQICWVEESAAPPSKRAPTRRRT